jgi:type VI secretion system secreted protein VgrG
MNFIVVDKSSLGECEPLSLQVNQSLSRNFEFVLQLESKNPGMHLDLLLGKPLAISLNKDASSKVMIHGYVVAAQDIGQRFDKYVYKIELSSWLCYLEQNLNCRIFQNVDVPEIVRQIFERYDYAKFRFDLQDKYDKREYCVQFRETDFDFVNRLLEDEGIWYYFEHTAKGHTLVISDKQRFPSLKNGYAQLDYIPDGEEGRLIRQGIQNFSSSRSIEPNNIVLRDYDYHKPSYLLHRNIKERQDTLQGIPLEWYDYGPGYDKDERGDFLARLRLQAWQAQGRVLFGESNAIGLSPGFAFGLSLHPDEQRNRGFKILSCKTTFLQDAPDNRGQGNTVKCEFVALADDVPFHPLRITPKPHVSGLHSATVVGPKGSEVHTDNMSRIRVHFHWDRYKTVEEDSSCWIRVSQAWAGKGWGVIAMPRVGQEVLITYVDGDLDRPLVTGIVYNGDNPPPYKLPERIRYSGIVSRSLRHGTPEHASQITIDDLRGNERVLIHAERDYQTTVERNLSTAVANNSTTAVAQTATTTSTNVIKIENSNYSSNARMAHFVGKAFSATGMAMGLNGTAFNASLFSTSASVFNTVFKGVTNSRLGFADSKFGLTSARIGTSIKNVAFSQGVRATAAVYTQHSQNFNSYIFTQNQLGITVNSAEETTVESEKIQIKNSHSETNKIEVKKDRTHEHRGSEQTKVFSRHIEFGGPFQKLLSGNSIRRIYGFKSEHWESDAKIYVHGPIDQSVKVKIFQKDHIVASVGTGNPRAPRSVSDLSGPGAPPQTTVTPPQPNPQVPDAAVVLNAVGTAAGPAVTGLDGAQALLQKYFSNSTGTNSAKPASSASK